MQSNQPLNLFAKILLTIIQYVIFNILRFLTGQALITASFIMTEVFLSFINQLKKTIDVSQVPRYASGLLLPAHYYLIK